jgi:uncharacterized protein (DUF1330 family)
MSAYVILILNEVNDLEWLAVYQQNVPPLVQQHGGEYIAMSKGFAGEAIICAEGAAPAPDAIGMLCFPTLAHVTDFFATPAYQPYRAMRVAATNGVAYAFEG